jgi:hypothetical protein
VILAAHFSGRPADPGADAVFDGSYDEHSGRLRLVQWNQPQELQKKLVAELVQALALSDADDELSFEESLGDARYQDLPRAFFWSKFGDKHGAAARAES